MVMAQIYREVPFDDDGLVPIERISPTRVAM